MKSAPTSVDVKFALSSHFLGALALLVGLLFLADMKSKYEDK
jgi:hypothetical protein